MRIAFTIAVLVFGHGAFSQTGKVTVNLSEDVTLTFTKDVFDPKNKKITIADDVVISIDNCLVFGTDGEMPTTYLKSGTLTIGSQTYHLQVDCMFDPWLGDYFNRNVFKLVKEGEKYKIQGGFSDGAGYYGVEWVAHGKGCTRTILTNDEQILFGYLGN